MKFCDYLKKIRLESGYTQQNIADLLGIDRSTYSYYEIGKTEPAIRHLKKLAELYNISLDNLLLCTDAPASVVRFAASGNEENAVSFRSLDSTEQQIVMLCRCVRDKDALLAYIRAYEEPENPTNE